MYANVVYNFKDSSIWYSTWDNYGNHIEKKVPVKPYLFVRDKNGHDAISIYEEPLQKMEFKDAGARRRFCDSTKKTYFNLPVCQQFLIDTFHGQQDDDSFSAHPLRIFFLDIETYSPNGFPNPLEARDEITVITIYDSITNHYNVFGKGCMYYTKDDDVIYHYYPDENTMLRGFVRWWRKHFPDIISGWYSFGFDLPYICNRLARIYGDEFAASKLSPVGRAWHKEDCKKRFGAVERIYDQLWTIQGVTHIDMQAAYYKFSPKKLESYSLNSVCSAEGLGQKLEYDGSLAEWWINNPCEFIDYNIQDVRLLVNLENKLKYMQLCRHMAYSALAPIGDALSTLPIITGLEALEALKRDRIISSFDNSDAKVEFEGGYVAEPKTGFSRSIVSLDVNSLYPSAIRTLNISNETKVGWFDFSEDGKFVDVRTVSGKGKRFPAASDHFNFHSSSLIPDQMTYLLMAYARTAACATTRRGKNNRKYQCFVLWRKIHIPAVPPSAPKSSAERKRTFSGILLRLRQARRLSTAIRKKEITFRIPTAMRIQVRTGFIR